MENQPWGPIKRPPVDSRAKPTEQILREPVEEGVLYITDQGACLQVLKEKGLPVAAWLHENNREQDLSAAAYAVENLQELDMDFLERVYRREKNIPWEILETDRCLVREMIPEDAEAFFKIYEEASIRRYMKDFHENIEGEAAYIRDYRQRYRFFEYGIWSIVLKATGEVIGRAGFTELEDVQNLSLNFAIYSKSEIAEEEPDGSHENVESGIHLEKFDGKEETLACRERLWSVPCLGYMIGVPWQRQGLAYEVCRAILEYGSRELGFSRVQLFVEVDNTPSINLAKKLGFVNMSKEL